MNPPALYKSPVSRTEDTKKISLGSLFSSQSMGFVLAKTPLGY
jgi:hypothetical protein